MLVFWVKINNLFQIINSINDIYKQEFLRFLKIAIFQQVLFNILIKKLLSFLLLLLWYLDGTTKMLVKEEKCIVASYRFDMIRSILRKKKSKLSNCWLSP